MSSDVRTLEPTSLWKNFAKLNAVPRPSKKEERVIAFMVKFGESLHLPTQVDEIGNVIIKKPASPGMEDRQTLVLQSHLDMVHQKNEDTNFDFLTEGIRMYVEGDWVKAKGTTLGADNGIGVATIMALLESDDIPHPPLEALFTIDEETGMTGAKELKGGMLDGSILLNLDTEDDDELTIGCAGGVDVSARGSYEQVSVKEGFKSYQLRIKGLSGGHSGMDIHRGLGNANKLMNRLLFQLTKSFEIGIGEIDGGGLRNAIPRESKAQLVVPQAKIKDVLAQVAELTKTLQLEHQSTDPDLDISIAETDAIAQILAPEFQNVLLRSIYACPNGIYRMSPDIPDLVQTSNNLARVLVKDGTYEILCLTRSSVDSEKWDEAYAISSTFELMGAAIDFSGDYPGWAPKPGAGIVRTMDDLYQEMFQEKPHVNACHAGLECGILGTHYPTMEMISFGPNIRGAHSPDEKVQISSVQKFWKFLLSTLERTPVILLALCFMLGLSISAQAQKKYYFPPAGTAWQTAKAADYGMDAAKLQAAVDFASANEYSGAKDLRQAILKGFEREPFHEILGPTKKRGGPAGMILKNGYLVASWGDTRRVDMTFSVTKSYLSTIAGLARQHGLIGSLQDSVAHYVWDGTFDGAHNAKINWHHLLTQSSDWSGQLWGGLDWADRPPGEGGLDEWRYRELKEPGTHFEYNDVRVNVLAYSLLQVWRKPLPMVLKEEIMDPIGASSTWRWYGYEHSWVNIDGMKMQSVSGGGHSGGGLFINTEDHARFGMLFLNNGKWRDKEILKPDWIKDATTSSAANGSYGYMWWLNKPGRRHWEGVAEEVFYAAGFGGNFIVIDQANDLVIVTRWLEPNKIGEMVRMVTESL